MTTPIVVITPEMATKLDELPLVLTIDEARKVLRIGSRQLRQAIARREVYAVKVGRSIRIPRSSIEAWLAGPLNEDDHQPTQLAVVTGGRHHDHPRSG